MTVEHRRSTLNKVPNSLSRIFDIDVDPYGWEKFIEDSVQDRIQLASICDKNWYETKFDLVKHHPSRFDDSKIDNDELFYFRSDFKKALIDYENPWKKVVKPSDIMTVRREKHDLP